MCLAAQHPPPRAGLILSAVALSTTEDLAEGFSIRAAIQDGPGAGGVCAVALASVSTVII